MVVNILIYILKSYQKIISPLLPGSCRYYPSCSQYTIEVLQKYGLYKGLVKAIWRILRCNPFSAGGYDPS
ncbi:membrane protein insertion efficiency factor YidD [Zhaonella formicivorans]|uniref:membrane protein insertion efficiency factor YidD n=1 Tax=Zhaonella formicivorans TaxID=2528593 RepID=UPI002239415F|nr:membrane protein insertion efficiency factor YidD [Zhaonella formicivorans]